MKTAKLVTGIVSIVLCVFVLFQSCAAGMANTLTENGEVGGSAGIIVAMCLIIGGIVGIATRNAAGKGGSIASAICYIFGAIIGFSGAGSYADLYIWSGLCVIFGAMYIIAAVKSGKNPRTTHKD